MKKIINIIFIGCMFIFVNTHIVVAACSDYGKDQTQCEANGCVYMLGDCSQCSLNQYRDTTSQSYICQPCTNIPADAIPTASGNDNDPNSCQWELTCSTGTVFVPNDDNNSGECQTCPDHYHSNRTTDMTVDYKVRYNGTVLQYCAVVQGFSLDNCNRWYTINRECVGDHYKIEFNSNSNDTVINEPRPIYEWYDKYYCTSTMDCIDEVTSVTAPYGIYAFNGYWTTPDTEGKQIFDANGSLNSNIGPKEFENDTTLYAHWDTSSPSTYSVYVNVDNVNKKYICDFIDGCTITVSGCNDGNFISNVRANGYATCSLDGDTIMCSLNESKKKYCLGQLSNNQPCFTIDVMTTGCPWDSYCTQCKETSCPYGSMTSNTGAATSVDDCHFTSDTVFTDKDNNEYYLPSQASLSNTLKNTAQE